MDSNRRVLGADRNLADIIPDLGGIDTSLATNIPAASRNSIYRAGDDISILLDEVLNNDISAMFIYDDFESFSDVDLYSLSIVMRKNTSVLAVTMSGVDIGDEIFGTFCESMLNSNVQYIDLCNTPLDEEAGRSIAGLAHNNTNLRTVIVEDTLISDEALDEIDLACLFNESTAVEISQKRAAAKLKATVSSDATQAVMTAEAYKEAMAAAAAKKAETPRLCVANEFNSCPHGSSCLFVHGAVNSSSSVGNGELSAEEAAKRRKGWEKLLQGEDEEEPAYTRTRNKKLNSGGDADANGGEGGSGAKAKPALKFTLNKPGAAAATETSPKTQTNSNKGAGGGRSGLSRKALVLGGGASVVLVTATVAWKLFFSKR
jgi:hypothetical protein